MKKVNEEIKALRIAERCLERALKEKDEEHKNSLMFQFNKQMARFSELKKETAKEEWEKKTYAKYQKLFDAFAKTYKVKNYDQEN